MTAADRRDADETLNQVRQQMLMARPWEAAEPNSIWEITGEYPKQRGTFYRCLAMTAEPSLTGADSVLFVMMAPAMVGQAIMPSWITHARPLLLVLRDAPQTAYWTDDQPYIGGPA